jgi:hypothetical protein
MMIGRQENRKGILAFRMACLRVSLRRWARYSRSVLDKDRGNLSPGTSPVNATGKHRA